MRKIVLSISVSLDGFIEGPDRDIGWSLVDEELHQHFNDELGRMSAFLTGRRTHELMVGFWPDADADPDTEPVMAEFARIWRDMPKIVFSRTVERPAWSTEVWREVDPARIRALQAQPGGDMVVGGPDLAASFIEHDLIDTYRIYVHPVLIGAGTPLFPAREGRPPHLPLRLVRTHTFGNGVVLLHHERDRQPAGKQPVEDAAAPH